MTAFIRADLRQTNDYGASFNQFLFDIISNLVDKSNEQVNVYVYYYDNYGNGKNSRQMCNLVLSRVKRLKDSIQRCMNKGEILTIQNRQVMNEFFCTVEHLQPIIRRRIKIRKKELRNLKSCMMKRLK